MTSAAIAKSFVEGLERKASNSRLLGTLETGYHWVPGDAWVSEEKYRQSEIVKNAFDMVKPRTNKEEVQMKYGDRVIISNNCTDHNGRCNGYTGFFVYNYPSINYKDDHFCCIMMDGIHKQLMFHAKYVSLAFAGYNNPVTCALSERCASNSTTKPETRKETDTMSKMNIKNVIYNKPATIVFWEDGSKTVVKCSKNDQYDPEKGLAIAIAKKALGNKGNYFNVFAEWLPEEG